MPSNSTTAVLPAGEPARVVLQATSDTTPGPQEETWWEQWQLAAAAVACWTLLLTAVTLDYLGNASPSLITGLYVGAYIAGGTFATRQALTDLAHGRVNVDLLMITAAIGAACVNAWAEGAMLLGLFSTSNALEHHALERTHRAVRSLIELSPEVATLVRPDAPGGEMTVRVEELTVGDIVLIRPGERIPVDGDVIGGESSVDQAAITGESLPVPKFTGSAVYAATMNGSGALQVRVGKLAGDSTLARIIAIVDEAREQKSETQRFAEAFEGKYAIGVIATSAVVAIVPWLFLGVDFDSSFYKAMTLLVVASPCALVISTPASTLSALANAARNGILFKGSNHLENMGAIKIIAFDKTGTLTAGKPRVTDIVPLDPDVDADELLRIAAGAERLSEHHLARALVDEASGRGLVVREPADFRAIPGKGIAATMQGELIAIGNEQLFAELGIDATAADDSVSRLRGEGKTAVIVASRTRLLGVVAVADTLRPSAAAVVATLKRQGIEQVVMLTGDNRQVGEAIGAGAGITDVRADLLPEEKLTVIETLQREAPVAMIGDGVNDAPALATASVGVAMGGAGTDVALETADVVLMADDLAKLPYAIALSRRTRRTIIQNIAISLSVIVVLVISVFTVGIPLPLGVVGHEGSTIIVVLNGLRLLRTKPV